MGNEAKVWISGLIAIILGLIVGFLWINEWISNEVATVIGLILNFPIFVVIGTVFFEDFDGFLLALRYMFTPDILVIFSGEYDDKRVSTFMLFMYVIGCAAALFGEYKLMWWLHG